MTITNFTSDSSTDSVTPRVALVLVCLVLASAIMPAIASADTSPITSTTDQPTLLTADRLSQETPENDSENSSGNHSGPTTASQVRISPDIPDADYVSVTTIKSDERFNTSGTFATFSLSEPVDAVRVEQPGGEVRRLGDGSVIQVQFASDAAPGDQSSLYTVELFFADGSTRTFEVMAHNTDVTASPTVNPEYAPVIRYLESQAGEMGFDKTPEGVQSYVENREERANLLEGLWTDQIETFLALRMAQAFSPLDWVAIVTLVGLLAYWLNNRHGWVLRIQQLAVSQAELVREAVRQDAERQRNAAAKHALSDVDGIGPNAERFWKKLDIETVENMIQVACKGIVAPDEHGSAKINADGNIVLAHRGIDDLQAVDPLTERALREETWLKPVILEGRLRASTALSHVENALLVAEMDYNRGAEVRETRLAVQELLQDLQGRDDGTNAKYSNEGVLELPEGTHTSDRPGGTPAGGDD